VTDNVTMNPDIEDRALWDRYVRLRRGAPEGAGGAEERVSGDDAALIAGYLDQRLDEWERAAFERRLVDEPTLLDTLLAARDALAVPPTREPAPQAVTAFALNLVPAQAVAARTPAFRPAEAPRRRWFLPSPAFAWSLVTVAFLAAFAAGAFVTWEFIEPPAMAQKDPIKDELLPRNNSIFDDPARTIFDGMDADE
jgi:hypothetical protein